MNRLIHECAIYFSHIYISVEDKSSPQGMLDISDDHFKQGFARHDSKVMFFTLLEFGWADARISLGQPTTLDGFERVIEVPFEVYSGTIYIGGPEETIRNRTIALEPGHYALLFAQRVLEEDAEEMAFWFERLNTPLSCSRVLRAEEGWNPPQILVEDAGLIPVEAFCHTGL